MIRVVFVYSGEPYDIYIGRGRDPRTQKLGRLGNPYSHKEVSCAKFKVATVEDAVQAYREYRYGLRPESPADWAARLRWIRENLRGKILGCWCNSPKAKSKIKTPCHGDVLTYIADSEQCDCCDRGGLYNGFQSGILLFECPKRCTCHD